MEREVNQNTVPVHRRNNPQYSDLPDGGLSETSPGNKGLF